MSFQQGLSGLSASSQNLDVIGNNVANASTYGAKSSRAEFADLYANAIGGAGGTGIGVTVEKTSQQFTQGNITTTGNPLDLAIKGDGFFEVKDSTGQTLYTRNGQFEKDKNGYLVNAQGQQLIGYPADSTGVIQPGAPKALQLPTAGINPQTTSAVTMEMNLDSRLGDTAPAGGGITFTDATTYNNATSLTAYDSKGQDVALTYYFQKSGDDQWNVYVTANGTSVSVDAANNPLPVTTVNFPTDGSAPTQTVPPTPITFNIPQTTNAQGALTVPISNVSLDLSGVTQYGAAFGVTSNTQDGYAPGQLASVTIDGSGVIMAAYSNGQSKPAGQLELASFRNPQGLQPLGGNAWAQTYASGQPVVGVPSSGNIGSLTSGALEESNVDLTGELVNMMTAQRDYQANSQTIKTEDSIMQTLVNLR
jgi:flagellar hook protein FlgE